jgi:hypothetical protein
MSRDDFLLPVVVVNVTPSFHSKDDSFIILNRKPIIVSPYFSREALEKLNREEVIALLVHLCIRLTHILSALDSMGPAGPAGSAGPGANLAAMKSLEDIEKFFVYRTNGSSLVAR